MALTNQQRRKIFRRQLVKFLTNQLTEDEKQEFVNAVETAIGTDLDTYLEAERIKWLTELENAKTSAQGQIIAVDAEIASLDKAN